MRIVLSIIWLIFVALFFFLGRSHWIEAESAIPPFELTERAMDKLESAIRGEVIIKGTPIDKPLKDFAKDFNEYLSIQNENSRTTNRRAAYGYFLASLTALVSMMYEWKGFVRKKSSRPGSPTT